MRTGPSADSSRTGTEGPPLLEVREISKRFSVPYGLVGRRHVSAVEGVSFTVRAGTTFGIVGESGCGKSTVARLILGVLNVDEGDILFEGTSVTREGRPRRGSAADRELRKSMQMVFQDPYSALNPRATIREIMTFPMKVHGFPKQDREARTQALLEQVGLHANHAAYYAHQLSGGQRQRVNIARALVLSPSLIVCDEPVSAVDKSVQAQILNLLRDLQAELGVAYVFISHDLNVVQYVSDEVLVMYLGQGVERAPSQEMFARALHPYTQALLASVPRVDSQEQGPGAAAQIEGELPSPFDPPSGCRFRTRCPSAMDICAQQAPVVVEPTPGHQVLCHLYRDGSVEPHFTRAKA